MAAAEVCSSDTSCPKISFSHYLSEPSEKSPRHESLPSAVGFAFFALNRFDFIPDQTSAADDIFSAGKIIPSAGIIQPSPPPPQSACREDDVTGGFSSNGDTTSYRRRLCSFKIMGKSNSTGSTRDVERVGHLWKSKSQPVVGYAKPPLKKKNQSGGGVHVDTVLKIPVTNLFCGFDSLCFSGKNRIKKNS